MKILIFSLLLAIIAPAICPAYTLDKFVCVEYNFNSGSPLKHTIVLEKANVESTWVNTEDGAVSDFRLTQYENLKVYPHTLALNGQVLTKDVTFQFTSEDKFYQFNVYLDEQDQSILTTFGKNNKVISRDTYFCY